jgi:hypothetical protein
LPRYLYASPWYLALSGEPKEPGDVAQHACLCVPKVAAWMLDRGTKKSQNRAQLIFCRKTKQATIVDRYSLKLVTEVGSEFIAD